MCIRFRTLYVKYVKSPMLASTSHIQLISGEAPINRRRRRDSLRPVAWGLVLSVLGGFFWVLFSVVYGVGSALSGRDPGAFGWALIYLTGFTMIFGVPGGIVGEIIRWRRGKKAVVAPACAKVTPLGVLKYCAQCGKQVQAGLSFCGYCGSKL